MTAQEQIIKVVQDEWSSVGGSVVKTVDEINRILSTVTIIPITDNCPKCKQKYSYTPICCHCGIIPITQHYRTSPE